MLRTVLIDDDRKNLDLLMFLLKEFCPEVEVIGSSDNFLEGIKLIKKTKPNLIFLDIVLNEETGFNLLETIKPVNANIIFMSAYEKFALNAFKYTPINYLLKPLDIKELVASVQRVVKQTTNNSTIIQDTLAVNVGHESKVIFTSDIIYFEGSNNSTTIYLDSEQKLFTFKTIGWFEGILNSKQFFRIHKKYIINLKQLKSLQKVGSYYCTMSDGTNLTVSRRKQDALQKKLFLK